MNLFERARTGDREAISHFAEKILATSKIKQQLEDVPKCDIYIIIVNALEVCLKPDDLAAYVGRSIWNAKRKDAGRRKVVSLGKVPFPSNEPSPEAVFERKHDCRLILDSIPPDWQEAVLKRVDNDKTYDRNKFYRARKRLREGFPVYLS